MRPVTASDVSNSRPRKPSGSDPCALPSAIPTTFFFARESDITRIPQVTTSTCEQDLSPVKTLKETLDEVSKQSRNNLSTHRHQEGRSGSRRRSTTIRPPRSIEGLRQEASRQLQSLSHSDPPSLIPSFAPSQNTSYPNSPKSLSSPSLHRSDDESIPEDTSSQAVESSEDECGDGLVPSLQDSAPQLIMPSIRMPSRRPFTASGKQLGKFKVLVAGSKGSGKTSLIKSIVQLCEDIVHVDPLTTSYHGRGAPNERASWSNVNEIYASTKPYPSWWSDTDESRILKRRKSVGDAVLERNICFVDSSDSRSAEGVANYIEHQLVKVIDFANQTSNELAGLLSGRGGGPQVDLVLFLITKETLSTDLERIRRLSQMANVVPLISKADRLPKEQISELKALCDVSNCALPQLHIQSSKRSIDTLQASAPYTVSSANGPDFDTMDASLLMSPEYVQPLVPSELSLLIEHIFIPENVAYLRHTSSKKLVTWYAAEPRLHRTISPPSVRSPIQSTLNSPLPTSLTNSGVLVPLGSELSLNTSNSYALAKVADHANREERLAQVRLSKWASDLQLSLQRERERYERLARGERALWLVQRMGEEVRDGQVLSVDNSQAVVKTGNQARLFRSDPITYQVHDPLGFLGWQDTVRTNGWIALQIMGSFGVVGGLALWLAKTCGWSMTLQGWAQEWGVWQE